MHKIYFLSLLAFSATVNTPTYAMEEEILLDEEGKEQPLSQDCQICLGDKRSCCCINRKITLSCGHIAHYNCLKTYLSIGELNEPLREVDFKCLVCQKDVGEELIALFNKKYFCYKALGFTALGLGAVSILTIFVIHFVEFV